MEAPFTLARASGSKGCPGKGADVQQQQKKQQKELKVKSAWARKLTSAQQHKR